MVKTDEPGIAHKSDVGGVRLGVVRDAALGPLLVISAGGVLIEIFFRTDGGASPPRTSMRSCPGYPRLASLPSHSPTMADMNTG